MNFLRDYASEIVCARYPNDPPHQIPYEELRLSEEDRKNIDQLIGTIARKSFAYMIWYRNDLIGLGESLQPLHPLKVLSYVSNNLKEDARRIYLGGFVFRNFIRNQFLEGFRLAFSQEKERENLFCYLPEFCIEVGLNLDTVHDQMEREDFDGFFQDLFGR